MVAKRLPPLADPRRRYAQTYRDVQYIRRVRAINEALRPWMPALALAGFLGLFYVGLKAIPVLWGALAAFLGAVGAAL